MTDAANPEMNLFERIMALHGALNSDEITEFAAVQTLVEEYGVPRHEADALIERDAFGEPMCEQVRIYRGMQERFAVRAAEQLLETNPGELGR